MKIMLLITYIVLALILGAVVLYEAYRYNKSKLSETPLGRTLAEIIVILVVSVIIAIYWLATSLGFTFHDTIKYIWTFVSIFIFNAKRDIIKRSDLYNVLYYLVTISTAAISLASCGLEIGCDFWIALIYAKIIELAYMAAKHKYLSKRPELQKNNDAVNRSKKEEVVSMLFVVLTLGVLMVSSNTETEHILIAILLFVLLIDLLVAIFLNKHKNLEERFVNSKFFKR